MKQLMFWVPQSGDIAIGISVVSYRGEVTIGVMVDDAVVGEPGRLAGLFGQELEKLRVLATAANGGLTGEQRASDTNRM